MNRDQVEKCDWCHFWISFQEHIVSIQKGKMGQDHYTHSGFMCPSEERFYHESCYYLMVKNAGKGK